MDASKFRFDIEYILLVSESQAYCSQNLCSSVYAYQLNFCSQILGKRLRFQCDPAYLHQTSNYITSVQLSREEHF